MFKVCFGRRNSLVTGTRDKTIDLYERIGQVRIMILSRGRQLCLKNSMLD